MLAVRRKKGLRFSVHLAPPGEVSVGTCMGHWLIIVGVCAVSEDRGNEDEDEEQLVDYVGDTNGPRCEATSDGVSSCLSA